MRPVKHQPMLTAPEAARRLRVKAETVRQFIACGLLRAVNVARPSATRPRWRIHESDLTVFENRRSGGEQPTKETNRRRRQNLGVTEFFK